MKAVNIIEELTKSPYEESDGVIHVNEDTTIWRAFKNAFGDEIDLVFEPNSVTNTGGKNGKDFLYIYTDRFPYRDNEVFAIIKDANECLIYLYEIE